jgi:hypothetical protein
MHPTESLPAGHSGFRGTQVTIAGGLLSWGVALAVWLTVDAATGVRFTRLAPHIPRLALDLGRWTFVPGCLLGLVALRQVFRAHSLNEMLSQVLGAAAVVGASTGALYALSIGPLHPKAWALTTGVPAILLLPVGAAISCHLWRRRGVMGVLKSTAGAAEPR